MDGSNRMISFHNMESDYKLFEIGKESDFPFWDIIRVHLYAKYINGYSDTFSIIGKSWIKTLWAFLIGLLVVFKRNRIIYFIMPRDVNTKGNAYDKIAKQLIDMTPSDNRLIINCIMPVAKKEYKGYSISLLLHILRLFIKKPNIDYVGINVIESAFQERFGVRVPHDELLSMYLSYYIQFISFYRLFSLIKPKKVICSVDQQKAVYWAAKLRGIPSYELQHAGIVFEYPSYSYPKGIEKKDNISFADYYVMFGHNWGVNNNIPCKRLVLGNDYFVPSKFSNYFDKPYIVIISDQDHVSVITRISEELSSLAPNLLIVFKLHPIQYTQEQFFVNKFKKHNNIKVITSECHMPSLLKNMQLMVTVYSSVFFEAMTLGKKVAVIENDIYYLLLPYMKNNPNARLVSTAEDILSFIGAPTAEEKFIFYSPFDREVSSKIIK